MSKPEPITLPDPRKVNVGDTLIALVAAVRVLEARLQKLEKGKR